MEVIVKGQPSIEIGFETKVIQVGSLGDIDSALSTESENPVQNKVITGELNKKADKNETDTKLTELSQEKEDKTNKVTSLTEESTDEQYPSAKAVYALKERITENEILIEDLQNTKIDKEADDYYPQLAVGLADNLAGVDVVDSEVNFRRSGGGAISDGVARIEAIKGNSVVWNQHIKGIIESVSGLSISISDDDIISINGTATSSLANFFATDYGVGGDALKNAPLGRYVLDVKIIDNPDNLNINIFAFNGRISFPNTGNYTTSYKKIGDCHSLSVGGGFGISSYGGTGTVFNNVRFKVSLYNLTQMFGAGNEPATIEEFYARIPMGVDINAYNEGEVIHMDVQSIESQGVNAWDEEWENGTFDTTTGNAIDGSWVMGQIRSENPIKILPNEEYCVSIGTGSIWAIFLDKEGNAIESPAHNGTRVGNAIQIWNSGKFKTPTNAASLIFYCTGDYGNTYNNDICINISDTSINGKYFPYIKRVEDLSIIRKYFPQGMKSAGTAHDEIRYNKATQKWEKVVRIGEVDLGTYRWYKDSSKDFFEYEAPIQIRTYYLCGKYNNVSVAQLGVDRGINVSDSGRGTTHLRISDLSYTNNEEFNASLQGVMLYYELAEPIVTELDAEDQFKDLDYQVWNCGTEKAIAEGKSAPLAADITYGFNAIGKIKELESLVAALRAKVGDLIFE